jgi:hypothetical protein
MCTIRLDRSFDAVFVHDACSYLPTHEHVAALARTCAAHLRPGGVALLCPDYSAESFVPSVDDGGHDSADGRRGLRYLEWNWDPDPGDGLVTADMAYLIREDGEIRAVADRHVVNAFPQAVWTSALEAVGFETRIVPFDHAEVPAGVVMYVGVRPV